MRSRPIILAAAALGLAAATFSVGCGSNCADTLTCEKPEPPGGAGGQGGDGGATTTTTTSSGGATSTGTAGGDPSTTTTGVGGAGGDPSTTTTGAGGEGGASTTSGGGGGAPPLLPLGEACVAGSECDSGICADGVCCDGACGGTCEACDLSGSAGTCTPYAQGTDPENECGLASCDGAGTCSVAEEIWSQQFGDASDQRIEAVAVDASNNIYVAGTFSGSITFGSVTLTSSGGTDVLVAKLASTGGLIWAKKFGGADDQTATHIAIAGSKVYVGGTYRGSPTFGTTTLSSSTSNAGWYAARIDGATGNGDWAVGQPGAGGTFGFPRALLGIGVSGSHLFVLERPLVGTPTVRKVSSAGVEVDNVFLCDVLTCNPQALDVAANGNLLIAGYFSSSTGFLGGPTLAPDGSDGFVVRANTNLGHVWSMTVGGAGSERLHAVADRPDGSIALLGTSNGTFAFGAGQVTNVGGTDAMVLTVSSGGIPTDAISFGGPGDDALVALAFGVGEDVVLGYSDGDVTIGGQTLLGAGGEDALVIKLSSSTLAPLWARRVGGVDDQRARGVGVDGLGRIAVGGWFRETLSFGTPLTSAGNQDAFLVQLTP